MPMMALLYGPALFLATFSLTAVALYALRRRDVPGSQSYALVLLSAALWALLVALETQTHDEAVKLSLHRLSWVGIVSVNVFSLYFLADYLHLPYQLVRWFPLLWVVPLGAVAAVLTNDWHHAFFPSAVVVDPPGVMALTPGPMLVIAIFYTLGLGIVNAFALAAAAVRSHGRTRRQQLLLLGAALAPGPFGFAYRLGLTTLDLTPLSFLAVAGLIAVAIYRYQLFSLLPVARDQLVRELRDGLLVLDAEGQVVSANPAWTTLFGSEPNLAGRPAPDVFAATPALIQLAAGTLDHVELELRSDPLRLVEVQASSVQDDKGQVQGRLLLARNVTQRRIAEAVIADHQQSLAISAARRRFDRELKDTLTRVLRFVHGQITMASDLIARGDLAPAIALLARLETIAADVDHGIARDIARDIAEGDPPPTGEDFFQALRQYLKQFGQTSGVYVVMSLPEIPTSVSLLPIVEAQVMRIIQEALNDIRARGQARAAQILFAREGDLVQITIADDGGFSEEAQTRLLENLNERTAAVGGRVQIDRTAEGGTALRVAMPAAAPEPGPGPLTGLRVVLADRQALVREGLRHVLLAYGVDVVGEAGDGPELVACASEQAPDLVLTELDLPRVDGAAAVSRIRAANPEIRCVVLTQSVEEADVTRALQSGVAGYLLKTQRLDEFLEALARLRHGERVFMGEVANRLATIVATGSAAEETLVDRLTAQQADVLRRVAEGMTYKEVGAVMHITERTVRYHMEQILDALGLASRSKAIAFAYRVGLARDRRLSPRPEQPGGA